MTKKLDIKKINAKLDMMEKSVNNLYKQTYFTSTQNKDDSAFVYNKLDDAINKVMLKNPDVQNTHGISRILTRLSNDSIKDRANIDNDMFNILNDQKVVGKVMEEYQRNKYIKIFDDEIDMVLKYMPKLAEALSIKVDNILSADSFSKEFLSIITRGTGDTDIDTVNNQLTEFRRKYAIEDTIEKDLYDICKYGEVWYVTVPYNTAFNALLKRKESLNNVISECVIFEDGIMKKNFDPSNTYTSIISDAKGSSFTVTFDKSGILASAVEETFKLNNASKVIHEQYNMGGLYESFLEQVSDVPNNKTFKFDKVLDDELQYEPITDGLINKNTTTKSTGSDKVNVLGAVDRRLKRENVIPLWIDKVFLGIFYVEVTKKNDIMFGNNQFHNSILHNMYCANPSHQGDTYDDEFIGYIAKQISEFVDANFINNNTDITKELYVILKYNDILNSEKVNRANMNISFIPAEDVHHFYFRMNEKTHRGISDIEAGLIPAKLWIALNLGFTHGMLTRGMDKRVYYVKQAVDTNVAQTLMNVLIQIKKGNFGIRQMESLSNVIGTLGQFNDYVIPTGPNGDAPVNMEVMNGQSFDPPTDFMANLEESAINPTDVPLELVNAIRTMDYAIHYTMSNSKFLRHVYKRQSKYQRMNSDKYTKIYNCEYNTNITLEFLFPAPAFLTMTNGSQMLANTSQYIDELINVELPTESEEVKALCKRELTRYFLPSHFNIVQLNKILERVKMTIGTEQEE